LYEVGDVAIFDWNQDILKRLVEGNLQEKQLTLLSYLFELLYDLALATSWNVSRSPGFVTPFEWFKKSLIDYYKAGNDSILKIREMECPQHNNDKYNQQVVVTSIEFDTVL
jgi:hypothetical protein